MHVAIALFVGLVAALFLGIVIGLAWFIAVPVGVLFVMLPFAWAMMSAARRHDSRLHSGAPTSGEASYTPQVGPNEWAGTTPQR
jgi:F0F1-type ATP synthase assembly protein I